MATISRKNFAYEEKIATSATPVFYVDSMNQGSFVAEMYSYTVKFIREQLDESNQYKGGPVIRTECMAEDENDIYSNKPDGFWIVSDEKANIVSLFKRTTSVGSLYNSVYVSKVFTLTCTECPRIVPKVFKQTTLFDNFTSELKQSVSAYRNRSDSLSDSSQS